MMKMVLRRRVTSSLNRKSRRDLRNWKKNLKRASRGRQTGRRPGLLR
jgi:hypothetical protein